MGHDPLAENEEIAELGEWLERVDINNIYDLSTWDIRDEWAGWNFHGALTHLSDQRNYLEELLEEATPIN